MVIPQLEHLDWEGKSIPDTRSLIRATAGKGRQSGWRAWGGRGRLQDTLRLRSGLEATDGHLPRPLCRDRTLLFLPSVMSSCSLAARRREGGSEVLWLLPLCWGFDLEGLGQQLLVRSLQHHCRPMRFPTLWIWELRAICEFL